MTEEPRITINGHPLTEAQATTVRVALVAFDYDISNPEMLKELGPIGPLYKERLREIYRLMRTT